MSMLSVSDPNSECGQQQDDPCSLLTEFYPHFKTHQNITSDLNDFLKDLLSYKPDKQAKTTIILFSLLDLSKWPITNLLETGLVEKWGNFIWVNLKGKDNPARSEMTEIHASTSPKLLCVTEFKASDLAKAIYNAQRNRNVTDQFNCNNFSGSTTLAQSEGTTTPGTGTTRNGNGTTTLSVNTTTTSDHGGNSTGKATTKSTTEMIGSTISGGNSSTRSGNDTTTTTIPITQMLTSTATTPSTTTTLSPYPGRPVECRCEPNSLWIDLMVLIESSLFVGKTYEQTVSFIKAILADLPIGHYPSNETDIGIIVYGNQASLISPLGKYASAADMLKDEWPFLGDEGTNIQQALFMAEDELVGLESTSRNASRKVILLFGSTYVNSFDYYDYPYTASLSIKKEQVIIISIGLGSLHGLTEMALRNISSPGFFVNFPSDNPKDKDFPATKEQIIGLLCFANCFCPGQLSVAGGDRFMASPLNGRTDIPEGGCFMDVGTSVNKDRGKHFCEQSSYPAYLAMPKYSDQQAVIVDHFKGNQTQLSFWVDLEKDSDMLWTWNDTLRFDPLGNNETIIEVNQTFTCAVLALDKSTGVYHFMSRDCMSSALIACQVEPCSSGNFCPADPGQSIRSDRDDDWSETIISFIRRIWSWLTSLFQSS